MQQDTLTNLMPIFASLIGSAGLAAAAGTLSQFTRTARLRHQIEKHAGLARSFDPESVPARSLMLTAQIAAIELTARRAIRLAGFAIYLSVLFGISAVLFAYMFVTNMNLVAQALPPHGDGGAGVVSVELVSTGTADLLSATGVWESWLLVAVSSVLALWPWMRLAKVRSQFERELLEDPALLEKARDGDVRVLVRSYSLFAAIRAVYGRIRILALRAKAMASARR